MAKAKLSTTRTFVAKPKKKRPGVHSKKKQSKNKNSKKMARIKSNKKKIF